MVYNNKPYNTDCVGSRLNNWVFAAKKSVSMGGGRDGLEGYKFRNVRQCGDQHNLHTFCFLNLIIEMGFVRFCYDSTHICVLSREECNFENKYNIEITFEDYLLRCCSCSLASRWWQMQCVYVHLYLWCQIWPSSVIKNKC